VRNATVERGGSGRRESTWPADPVELIRRLYPLLFLSAARLVERDQVDDLVQETLVELLARQPDLSNLEHPLGYARTIQFRLACSRRWVRLRQIVPVESLDDEQPDETRTVELGLDVASMLERLGPRQRACVVLRFLYGLTDREIGDVIGCRASTVRSQITRAMATLRTQDDPLREEPA
jgi:RNA polymerase sigma factor (sigma-70 family)